MRKPSSRLRAVAARVRRPSPAMAVAVVALFMSLGGASYAAISLPAASVGTKQLQNNAVSFRKIAPHSVGVVRIVPSMVQLRVKGTCTGPYQAISSINMNGSADCATTGAAEADSGVGKQTTVAPGTTATTLASYSLAGGTPYLVQATPRIEVSGSGLANNHVTVTCKLAAGTATTAVDTESTTVTIDPAGDPEYASLPLTVTAPSSVNAMAATLSCTQSSTTGTGITGTPTVAAQGTIYALGVSQITTPK